MAKVLLETRITELARAVGAKIKAVQASSGDGLGKIVASKKDGGGKMTINYLKFDNGLLLTFGLVNSGRTQTYPVPYKMIPFFSYRP